MGGQPKRVGVSPPGKKKSRAGPGSPRHQGGSQLSERPSIPPFSRASGPSYPSEMLRKLHIEGS
eukprot:569014-Prymnesium_polylepis.1